MKSAKVMKKLKAKTRKPTVPKDVLAVITEGFSGHEKLYDAVGQLWIRTSTRIFELPNPERFSNYRMFNAIHEKMRNALYKGVLKANDRRNEKLLARFIEPRRAK